MTRCVIVGGAEIHNYAFIKRYLSSNDFYIFCDSGLNHLKKLDVTPNLIVGDFDSHPKPDLPIETIVLPREKDDTDTIFAVKEALKRGFQFFLLIGVTGNRFDHTMGNISILLKLNTLNKNALIIEDNSVMQIVNDKPVFVDPKCSYFSLLNMDGHADKITIKNAKFPLKDAAINVEYQYGISNECLPGQNAEIFVKEGRLLLVTLYNTK